MQNSAVVAFLDFRLRGASLFQRKFLGDRDITMQSLIQGLNPIEHRLCQFHG